ncbi:hypothetical protein M405DRAFT_827475 [Rhizopogon salebrosus TDB-379]|nr:hypothetical protein M405DRAFT_827475 [Rhizopogon salebrosus TDB-379]
MRLVLIFFWLHAAIIIVAAPIESNKARRAPIAGPMTQLEAADDDYSSTVANGHDFVESNTLGSGGVTSVSAADVTLATKTMTAPTETSVVAPTAKNETANILSDINEMSLKLNTIGLLSVIQD